MGQTDETLTYGRGNMNPQTHSPLHRRNLICFIENQIRLFFHFDINYCDCGDRLPNTKELGLTYECDKCGTVWTN